jgi:hypothetical protein
MTVSCQLTNVEMTEAARLNTTAGTWGNLALRNGRLLAYMAVLVVIIVARTRNPAQMPTRSVGGLLALIALFFALFVVKMYGRMRRRVKAVNEVCTSFRFDGQGMTVEGRNGTTNSIPWSAIHRWREGKLVFTIGEPKSFYTVPKIALGEMQAGELRSLLMANVR